MSNPFHPNAVKHNIIHATPEPRTSKGGWIVVYLLGCFAVVSLVIFGLSRL